MQQIQEWFDRIAGVSPQEYARLRTAESVFRQPGFDPAPFQKPACWRRRARIGVQRSRG